MKYLSIEEKKEILKEYQGGKAIGTIAINLHLSERRVRRLLIENGVTIQDPHKKTVATDTYVEDKQKRFPHHDGFKYIAVCNIDQKEFDDYENKSGALVRHLKEVVPDYHYYNEKIERYRRFHKMRLSKQILHKKYGFPLTMTEKEMAKELGYDRIWDCGLVKYVWTPASF